jgi:F-box/leucine-rich repeat protein 2/20
MARTFTTLMNQSNSNYDISSGTPLASGHIDDVDSCCDYTMDVRLSMGKCANFETQPELEDSSTVFAPNLEITRESITAAPLAKRVDGKGYQTRSRGPSTSWLDIPPEIKIKMFTYLEPKDIVRCSRVSRDWHRICYDGQLWSSFDVAGFDQRIPADAIASIITKAGPFLCDLNLRGCVLLDKPGRRRALLDACTNLRSLSLKGCRIDGTTIHSFLHAKDRLVLIDLSYHEGVTNNAMNIIAASCPKLERLNVSWCNNVDTHGLHRVVEACPKLKDIQASEVDGWGNIEFMQQLFLRNSLERLVLTNCGSLTDESLAVLMQGRHSGAALFSNRPTIPPRKLNYLDLTQCLNISNRGIRKLVNNIPKMQKLKLSMCRGIVDETLVQLLPTTPVLTGLDLGELEQLTSAMLHSLASSPCARHLRYLRVTDCIKIDDTGMLAVLRSCTNLWSLEMDGTPISDLVLIEAALMVSRRTHRTIIADDAPFLPTIGLSLSVHECFKVTWIGIREILSCNTKVITEIKAVELQQPAKQPAHPPKTATDVSHFPSSSIGQLIPFRPAGPRTHEIHEDAYPTEIIAIYVGPNSYVGPNRYRPMVQEHTNRVLRGEFFAARRLEYKWAESVIAEEKVGASGMGSWRRRRRARKARRVYAEEGGLTVSAGFGASTRWSAQNGGCAFM